jgi:hypothetical protein
VNMNGHEKKCPSNSNAVFDRLKMNKTCWR